MKKTLAALAGLAAPLVLGVPAQAAPPVCDATSCDHYQLKTLPNGDTLIQDNFRVRSDDFKANAHYVTKYGSDFTDPQVFAENTKGSFSTVSGGICYFSSKNVAAGGDTRQYESTLNCTP